MLKICIGKNEVYAVFWRLGRREKERFQGATSCGRKEGRNPLQELGFFSLQGKAIPSKETYHSLDSLLELSRSLIGELSMADMKSE